MKETTVSITVLKNDYEMVISTSYKEVKLYVTMLINNV